jgi:hypothetical protein
MAWWGLPFFQRLKTIGKGLIWQLKIYDNSVMAALPSRSCKTGTYG